MAKSKSSDKLSGNGSSAVQLFEEAVTSQDEKLRSRLANFLHAKHPRTCAAVKVRVVLEPDSLGASLRPNPSVAARPSHQTSSEPSLTLHDGYRKTSDLRLIHGHLPIDIVQVNLDSSLRELQSAATFFIYLTNPQRQAGRLLVRACSACREQLEIFAI
jgi:hypothetical protein